MEGKRRKSRETVLRLLYSLELNPKSLKEALQDICIIDKIEALDEFTIKLFEGVINNKEKIDAFITEYVKNWKIERIALIDKNIMRLAIFEMTSLPDIPHIVSINEAVDIAKKYSTKDSGKFVNGILDNINKDLSEQNP
ncbi:MAG: transcription antitermination factor NusB [Candidatus Aureabacteria bacterium]|nr:transcription antitermination factor NusB [Candidatus Auribacterota bacterium]